MRAFNLSHSLEVLRSHREELFRMGVRHAAVFGSVARGEPGPGSDVDVLVELDTERGLGVFEYARIRLEIQALFEGKADVANRRTLKPLLREHILAEAVEAF